MNPLQKIVLGGALAALSLTGCNKSELEAKLDGNSSGVYEQTSETSSVKRGKYNIIDIDGDGKADIFLNPELVKGIVVRRESFDITIYKTGGREYSLADDVEILHPYNQIKVDELFGEGPSYEDIKIPGKDFTPTINKTTFVRFDDGRLVDIDGDGKADFLIGPSPVGYSVYSRREGFQIKSFSDGEKTYPASANTRIWKVPLQQESMDKCIGSSRAKFWKKQ